MKKKITSVILFILIILIATTIYAAVTANAGLTASKSKVKPGEEFTIKLNIKDIEAGSDGLMGAQLKIDYDKNIFETLTDSNIKGLSGLTAYYNESNKGNILIVSGMSGIKIDSDFVEITFKVKETVTAKDATITLQDIEIFNLEKANLGSKSVTVEITNENAGNTTPTPTPDGGSESTPTPSTKPNTTPTPTGNNNQNSGNGQGNLPITNIDTNTSSGSGTSGTSSGGTTIKGSTTSSSSLPKAGIGSTIAILTVVVAALGTVSYIKLRKYREI